MGNCYDCKHALESKLDRRLGEHVVRCAAAEEMFGGTRWVKVLPESKCGKLEPFQGDTSVTEEKREKCEACKGSGVRTIKYQYIEGTRETEVTCTECKGDGLA